MSLYHFHRVLISAAILFSFGFALYAYRQYGRIGGGDRLSMAVISGVVAAGLIAYLVYFNLKLMRTARDRSHWPAQTGR